MDHTSARRKPALRGLARVPRHGVAIAVPCALLAGGGAAAYLVHGPSASAARFVLSAAPSQQAIPAGSTARYRISVTRRGFRGPISLSVTGGSRDVLPHVSAQGGSSRMLTVITSGRAATGQYRLTVHARGGAFTRVIGLGLRVNTSRPIRIGISGTVTGLQPGLPSPVDLTLANRSKEYLWVTGLTVTPTRVLAPRSSVLLPCTLADFSLQQYSGLYPIVLPPLSTRTLSSLGIRPAQRPRAMLLNRPLDQDGCQGATVTLAYSARGVTV